MFFFSNVFLSLYREENGGLDLVMRRTVYVFGWNSIPHCFHSPEASFTSSCWSSCWSSADLISRYRIQSSAKSISLELVSSGRSLLNIKNNTGPKTEPCGTQLTTGTFSDDWPSTRTCSVLELSKDDLH